MKKFYRYIPYVLTCAFIFFGIITHSSQLRAQVSFNTTLLGHLQFEESASDIWGYVDDSTGIEYAIMGLRSGTSIIDVSTDPANPTEVAFVPGPSSIWRDIKTHSHYAYVVNETSGGVQIIDLSQPDSAFEVTSIDFLFTRAHNLYIDDGFAYVVGTSSDNGGIWILDLANPEAPNPVGLWNTAYVHDIYVRNDTAYAAAIREDGSVYILDVADKFTVSQIAHFTYPNGNAHNTWTSDDGRYLYTTDEQNNGTLKVWDISDMINIAQVGEYQALSNTIIHNVLVKEPFGFISYYVNGVRIVDLSDPTLPVEVGFYDTFPGPDDAGFSGNWGIYPFAPSGNLYISDIDSGFYLVAFDSVRAGGVEGVVSDATTGLPIPGATLHFIEANKSVSGEEDGTFLFNSAEGEHHIIAVAPGYFESDTLALTIVAGETSILDLTLQPFIAISVDMIPVTIQLGDSTAVTFEVTNLALDTLAFSIRDINGPLPPTPAAVKSHKRDRGIITGLFWKEDWSQVDVSSEKQSIPISAGAAFEEIISDPVGDMLFGTAPDVISVQAEKTSTHMLFRIFFAEDVDMDSAAVVLSLDTDHNAATGVQPELSEEFAVFDIGAEFDVVPILPGVVGFPPLTLLVHDYNTGATILLADAVSADSNMIEFAVPLSEIGDDDGNMYVVGFSTHVTQGAVFKSVDIIPNMGHGTVGIDPFGDPEWLSVSPTADTLSLGEASTITVYFNSEGLIGDTVYTALLLVESVDPFSLVLDIPVTMFVSTEPVAVDDDAAVKPLTYALVQNYPNPFNPITTIKYSIPLQTDISLVIYNLMGQEVMRWDEESVPAGYYEKIWNGTTRTGISIASGVYLYRLQAGDFVQTRKMVLLK